MGDVLPANVRMISPNPSYALRVSIGISILIGFILTLPVAVYNVAKFLNPALYSGEKRTLFKYSLMILPLFLLGIVFSYFIFLPLVFEFLFAYLHYMEVIPVLDLAFFYDFTFLMLFVFGIIFLLPLLMRALSVTQIVKKETWKKHLWLVLIASTIIGAIITPDGTGITQILFAGTLILLYGVGVVVSPKD